MDPSSLQSVPDMVAQMANELTLARARIKEMERGAEVLTSRAHAAECALGAVNGAFYDATRAEPDSKARVKQEVREDSAHGVPSVGLDPRQTRDAPTLERAAEVYHEKYRGEREAKRRLRGELKECRAAAAALQERLARSVADNGMRVGIENELAGARAECRVLGREKAELKAALKAAEERAETATASKIMHTQKDVEQHMSELPKPINRLRQSELSPVCLSSLDLRAYVEYDPKFKAVGRNLLYLPNRILWCASNGVHGVHAFAVGPMHAQSKADSPWNTTPAFDGLYGKTFHLFCSEGKFVLYAGFYRAIDLREKCPLGIALHDCSTHMSDALAKAATPSAKSSALASKLYAKGAFRVEPLGLQCIDFDPNIYAALLTRFASVQSVVKMQNNGKRLCYYPEDASAEGGPKRKRRKTEK